MTDDDFSAGRTHFSMKNLHEDACFQKQLHGNSARSDRTELKVVLLRYPILREEPGFRRGVIFVTNEIMEDLATTFIAGNCTSSDYKTVPRPALICHWDTAHQLKLYSVWPPI